MPGASCLAWKSAPDQEEQDPWTTNPSTSRTTSSSRPVSPIQPTPLPSCAGVSRPRLPQASTGIPSVEPGSFIDSQFRHCESDLLFSAAFGKPEEAGEEERLRCCFYFLLEHFSGPAPFAALQVLRYMTRIWERHLAEARAAGEAPVRLPVVVPVVVAQNDGSWEISPRFSDLLKIPEGFEEVVRPYIPDFAVSLLQLAEIPYEAIAGTPSGILALRALKAERIGEQMGDVVWDEGLMSQVERAAREFFELLVRYLMRGGVDTGAFERRVEKIVEPRLRSTTMTIAEQYIERGIERGIEKGQRADILEALEIRFGAVPEGLRETVEGTSGSQRLRELHRSAIMCATLEEFARSL